jgi:hypothetical protein
MCRYLYWFSPNRTVNFGGTDRSSPTLSSKLWPSPSRFLRYSLPFRNFFFFLGGGGSIFCYEFLNRMKMYKILVKFHTLPWAKNCSSLHRFSRDSHLLTVLWQYPVRHFTQIDQEMGEFGVHSFTLLIQVWIWQNRFPQNLSSLDNFANMINPAQIERPSQPVAYSFPCPFPIACFKKST